MSKVRSDPFTVQEQKLVWGANTDPTSLMSVTTTPSTLSATLPTVTMRFTEMSLMANTATKRHILSTGGTNLVKTFSLQDCQVHGGYLYNQNYNNNPNQMTVTLLNNLLERTDFTFNQGYQGDTTPFLVTMRNNLVLKSTLNLWTSTTASQTWHVHDNFFDTVALNGSGSSKLVHTHNGYRATTQISGTTSGNVTITTADYQIGPLGNYYYPTAVSGQNLARLIDVGSQTADAAGLAGYTTQTSQEPESCSIVDIGFHYQGSTIRSGFDQNAFAANDDDSIGPVSLPLAISFFGTSYSSLYINENGNVTFDAGIWEYTPIPLAEIANGSVQLSSAVKNIIAPFWADIDTRAVGSPLVTYGAGTVNGRNAFAINWINLGYYTYHMDKVISCQLGFIDRGDRDAGDYDVEFNYSQIQWETGDFSGGSAGLGGSSARVGFASADGSSFEMTGSGTPSALLDSNLTTGLIHNNFNSCSPGRYIFQFHNGTPIALP